MIKYVKIIIVHTEIEKSSNKHTYTYTKALYAPSIKYIHLNYFLSHVIFILIPLNLLLHDVNAQVYLVSWCGSIIFFFRTTLVLLLRFRFCRLFRVSRSGFILLLTFETINRLVGTKEIFPICISMKRVGKVLYILA